MICNDCDEGVYCEKCLQEKHDEMFQEYQRYSGRDSEGNLIDVRDT